MQKNRFFRHCALFTLVMFVISMLPTFPICPAHADHFSGGTQGASEPDNSPPDPPDKCGSEGGMIYLWDGREHFETTDLVIPGYIPIVLSRCYDSRSNYDSPLGYGWSLNYNTRLYENKDGSIVMRTRAGYRHTFVQDGGSYVTPRNIKGRLEENIDGTYTFIEHEGQRQHFDAHGRLTSIEEPRGNRLVMEYDPRGKLPLLGMSPFSPDPQSLMIVAYDYRLTRVKEQNSSGQDTGTYVDFSYDEATGRVTKARDDTTREIVYGHNPLIPGQLTSVTVPNGSPNGNVLTYEYNDPNGDMYNITLVSTSCGAVYQVDYDEKDRVFHEVKNNGILAMDYETEGIPLVKTVITRTVKDDTGQTIHTFKKIYEFNDVGEVTSITDNEGNVTEYVRNENGYVLSKVLYSNTGTVEEPVLVVHSQFDYTYDTDGNRLTETITLDSGEVITKTFTYDHNWLASEKVVSSLEPTREFKTEYTFYYDAEGSPTNIHEKSVLVDNSPETWLTTEYQYDDHGQLDKIIAPNGDEKDLTYTDGLLTNEDGIGYGYDDWGNRNSVTDKRGKTTQYVYDAGNRLVGVTNALDEETIYTYTGCNLTQVEYGKHEDDPGKIVTYGYDSGNRLTSVTLGTGASAVIIEQRAYDSDGNVIARTDGDGNVTQYTYDEHKRLVSITDPLLHATQFEYDVAGNVIRKTDANNHPTEYTYDDLNRLIAVKDALNKTFFYTYDAANHLLSLEDPKNHTNTFTYDLAGRLKTEKRPLQQTFQYFYDDKGRLDHKIDAEQQETTYTYNTDDRLLTAVFGNPAQRTITLTRDPNGNIETYSDTALAPSGTVYTYTYDDVNRVETVANAFLNKTLEYAYNHFGLRSNLTVKEGANILFSYDYTYDDDTNLAESLILSGSQTVSLEHYASGRLKTVTYPNDMTENLSYPDGRLSSLQYLRSDASVLADYSYTYDNVGNITNLTAPEGPPQLSYGNTDYSYDDNNRLQSYGNVTLGYNENGSTISKTVDGNTTNYTYNLANRLTQVTATGLTASYRYDFLGRRVEKDVNGEVTRFLYDGTTLLAELDATNTLVKRYAYLPGHLTPIAMTVEGGSGGYAANSAGQLTPIAMMDEESGSYAATNSRSGFLQSLVVDAYKAVVTGTPVVVAAPPANPTITELQPSECEPGEVISIIGRKFGATQGSSVVHVGTDTFDSGSSNIQLWSDREIQVKIPDYECEWFEGEDFKDTDVWVTVGGVDSNHEVLKVTKPETCPKTYYFLNDHLGFPRRLVDNNETVVWTSTSQVFGLATVDEDPDGDGLAVVNNIRFLGQYYDQETGLHYNYHRYYDPRTGRYLSPDPSHSIQPESASIPYLLPFLLAIPQTVNLFPYVHNNPVNFVDPEGLFLIGPGLAILVEAAGPYLVTLVEAVGPYIIPLLPFLPRIIYYLERFLGTPGIPEAHDAIKRTRELLKKGGAGDACEIQDTSPYPYDLSPEEIAEMNERAERLKAEMIYKQLKREMQTWKLEYNGEFKLQG